MERLTVRNEEGIGVLKQPYQCERCGDLQWSLPDLGNGSPIDRLAEYEDLEEQGKLLKLPCKVGDTVWDNDFGKPFSYTVTGFSSGKIDSDEENDIDGLCMYYRNWNGSICCSCAVSEIGKTVFLTHEEVEVALKRMKETEEI